MMMAWKVGYNYELIQNKDVDTVIISTPIIAFTLIAIQAKRLWKGYLHASRPRSPFRRSNMSDFIREKERLFKSGVSSDHHPISICCWISS